MKTKTEYDIHAETFLKGNGIAFKVVHMDSKCPLFCDGKHTHGDRHKITFKKSDKSYTLQFWNSYNDMQGGKLPDAYDVLSCLTKYDPGSFDEFCSEYGYDMDSRKAEKTYKAVLKEYQKVSAFFTADEIEKLGEIQ